MKTLPITLLAVSDTIIDVINYNMIDVETGDDSKAWEKRETLGGDMLHVTIDPLETAAVDPDGNGHLLHMQVIGRTAEFGYRIYEDDIKRIRQVKVIDHEMTERALSEYIRLADDTLINIHVAAGLPVTVEVWTERGWKKLYSSLKRPTIQQRNYAETLRWHRNNALLIANELTMQTSVETEEDVSYD